MTGAMVSLRGDRRDKVRRAHSGRPIPATRIAVPDRWCSVITLHIAVLFGDDAARSEKWRVEQPALQHAVAVAGAL